MRKVYAKTILQSFDLFYDHTIIYFSWETSFINWVKQMVKHKMMLTMDHYSRLSRFIETRMLSEGDNEEQKKHNFFFRLI